MAGSTAGRGGRGGAGRRRSGGDGRGGGPGNPKGPAAEGPRGEGLVGEGPTAEGAAATALGLQSRGTRVRAWVVTAAMLALSLVLCTAGEYLGGRTLSAGGMVPMDGEASIAAAEPTGEPERSLDMVDHLSARAGKPFLPPAKEDPTPTSRSSPAGGPLRVGLQIGHWKSEEFPDELTAVKGTLGAYGDGWDEVEVNLEVGRRVADLLARERVQVDLLPATVPPHYRADAFVALHADSAPGFPLTGFKVARSSQSLIPAKDDALVKVLRDQYQGATGLPEELNTVSDNMTEYYAFNYRRYDHAVDPSTPAMVLEMGFLSNAVDRGLLLERQEVVAAGVAGGILRFLGLR